MTCFTCGREIPADATHGGWLSCVLALKRENEMLRRQLLSMDLGEKAAGVDADGPMPGLAAESYFSSGEQL